MKLSKNKPVIMGVIVGVILGALVGYIFRSSIHQTSATEALEQVENKPLYWVAPMDPNYRRNQPGKSPMGMDLIPYYGNDANTEEGNVTVEISPQVINSLGVRMDTVSYQQIETTVPALGTITFNEDQVYHTNPRVEGWIEKLHIKSSGETVTKNQAIYDIYSPQLVNAQEEFLLALSQNNSQLIQASEEKLKSLQFSKGQIEQLRKNKSIQQSVTFYTPYHGVVDTLNIKTGSYVKPSDTLMSIINLDHVWVEVDILKKQAASILLNQAATMTLDYVPGKTWYGQVDFIYPIIDAKTRTLKARLVFENTDYLLKPNMYAQISIAVNHQQSRLVIPYEALIRTGGSSRVVLASGEGQFKSIKVKTGEFYDHYIEVLEGLQAGDQIVTSAQFLIDSESNKSMALKRLSPDSRHGTVQETLQ